MSVQFGDGRLDKIDASTWDVMHLKKTTYTRCFIDMSLYNNFIEETNADVLWKKIDVMFVIFAAIAGISVGQVGDTRCHIGQCRTEREAFIPREGQVDLIK